MGRERGGVRGRWGGVKTSTNGTDNPAHTIVLGPDYKKQQPKESAKTPSQDSSANSNVPAQPGTNTAELPSALADGGEGCQERRAHESVHTQEPCHTDSCKALKRRASRDIPAEPEPCQQLPEDPLADSATNSANQNKSNASQTGL